mmetsp:Transcript_28106/g.59055  ORF Transcript_28106/g.59055 Transcript_28106/m.59055 type:complete len:141 (-) Transcript_28106:23-445(-)
MTLVVGMADGAVLIWRFSDKANAWQNALALEAAELSRPRMAHLDCVHDVSWAADVGRSYHLIATASRDKSAKLWHLKESDLGDSLHATCACELAHSSQVWRVEWNVCGSLLAASVDEGRVHVYKLDAKGEWSRAWSTHPK